MKKTFLFIPQHKISKLTYSTGIVKSVINISNSFVIITGNAKSVFEYVDALNTIDTS